MCSLRRTFAYLFLDFPSTHGLFLDESGALIYAQAVPRMSLRVLQKQTNEAYRFISDIHIFCAAGTVEQAEQPNYLAEGTCMHAAFTASAQIQSRVRICLTALLSGYHKGLQNMQERTASNLNTQNAMCKRCKESAQQYAMCS
eukprot:scaffold73739_cov21-Tisochrysis_lutea.AAC.1